MNGQVDNRNEFKWTSKHIFVFAALGLAYPGMIGFVCMQYVYYDAMLEVMGITNAQLGFLMTVDAIGAMLLALPGGMLADKLDCRKVLAWSLIISAGSCVMFAIKPTYTMALVVWSITAVTMCGFYGSVYKVVRIIAPANQQGKAYGMFGVFNAIGFILVNMVSLKAYTIFEAKNGAAAGLSAVLWIFTAVIIIGAVLGYFAQSRVGNPKGDQTEVEKITLKQIVAVLKHPGTYQLFVVVFTAAVLHTTSSYFTPYLTHVLGTTMILSSTFAVIRQYGMRIISSPLGGVLGDKLHSNSLIVAGGFFISAIGIFGMIFFGAKGIAIAIVLILGIAFMDNMLVSIEYSICEEAQIPSMYMGTTTGLVTIILPDLFVPAMYGHWLDTYGNEGYKYIFIFCIVMCIIGVTAALSIIKRGRKIKANKKLS